MKEILDFKIKMAWIYYLSQGMFIGILDWFYNLSSKFPIILIMLFSVNYVMGLGYYYLFSKRGLR